MRPYRRKRVVTGKWHADETYIKVRGRWTYLYRAIDSNGCTVEFWPSARDRRLFRDSADLDVFGMLWRAGSCCVADAEAKFDGKAGCGCGSKKVEVENA